MATATLALIIIAAILVQVSVVILLGLYRRKREYMELGTGKDTPQTVASSLSSTATAAMVTSTPAWQGFREFLVQRREFEDAKHSMRALLFTGE